MKSMLIVSTNQHLTANMQLPIDS